MTFLQQLAQTILQRDDIALKDTLIVLPNKRARRMLQKELATSLSQPCFSPTIFSIDEFIHKLSDYTLCDDIELLHTLFKAYRQFEHAREEKLASFLSWAETFIHDISEIDMQLADASKIFGNLSDIKELETVFGREKLTANQQRYLQFYATLYHLYSQFNSFLDEDKLAYEGKIYKDTAENIIRYAQKFNFKRYIFAGFQTLSPSEMEIVQYYHQEHQAELYFDIDEFYRKNYTPFISILQNKLKIKELEWIHTDYASIPKQINIVGASKSMNQILYAIEQLNRIEQEEGSLNNTVLVFADEKLLTPFIHCYDCGKANLTMGYPLNATPAYALLSVLLETARNSQRFQNMQQGEFLYYHRDVFSFFRNPLVVNYLFPDKNVHEQFLKELIALNSIFFTPQALDFCGYSYPNLSGTPVEILKEIQSFLSLLSTQTADDKAKHFDHYCLSLLCDNLQQALNHIQEFDPKLIDLESSIFILNKLIQRISIPLKGSPSEGLQIMGLLETRALDFKNIIMLSVNEGTLPAGRSSNSLILHEVKKYFNLPTYQEKDTVYGYHFFRLLQRAEQIHLIYDNDSTNSLAEKSRFLNQLDFEVKSQEINNINIKELVLPTLVNTERNSTEISITKNETILQQLKKKEYSYTHLNDYLNCPLQFYLKHIAEIKPADDISESVEQKLIGDAIHHLMDDIGQALIAQPTAYPQIIENALKNIDTQVEAAMKKAILEDKNQGKEGTMHNAQCTMNNADNLSTETCNQKTEDCQLSTVNSKVHVDLTHGKSYLATEVVKKAITTYLKSLKTDFEKAEKEQYSFKIIATEQKMNCTIDVDQNPIQLKGYADRIDQRNGIVILLDYKTGYVDDNGLSYEKFDDIFTGTEHKQLLQLLMYAYLYNRDQVEGSRYQGMDGEIQNSEFKIQNSNNLSSENCKLITDNCQLSTVNCQLSTETSQPSTTNSQLLPATCDLPPKTYACGIISFQRLYQKIPHELYPTFLAPEDNNQETGDSGQGTDDGMHNEQCTMHNADNLSTETCNLKPDNCQLSTFNSDHLITPEILQLFEKHLINLLRDIINPKKSFCQTDDVKHCTYCDYSAICKRQHTKDE
jgi:hypothetical protein